MGDLGWVYTFPTLAECRKRFTDKINRDVVEILARPDVAEKTRGIQMEPVTKSRMEAAQFFVEEAQLWGKVIRRANIPLQ